MKIDNRRSVDTSSLPKTKNIDSLKSIRIESAEPKSSCVSKIISYFRNILLNEELVDTRNDELVNTGLNLDNCDLRNIESIDGVALHLLDFRNANLKGANLSNLDLEDFDLSKANLQGANLEGANLQGAKLESANLEGANLSGTLLTNSILTYANFSYANLDGAVLKNSKSWMVNFYRSNLSCADLTNADCYNSNFFQALLLNTRLHQTGLLYCELTKPQLNRAIVSDCPTLNYKHVIKLNVR